MTSRSMRRGLKKLDVESKKAGSSDLKVAFVSADHRCLGY